MTNKEAKKILEYLKLKKMAFCFYNGILVSREDCYEVLK